MNELVQCPTCQGQMLNDGSLSGHVVSCPHCRMQLQMPQLTINIGYAPEVSVHSSSHVHNYGIGAGGRKEPGIAALLSFFWCGAGQIYVGSVGLGLLLFFGQGFLAFMAAMVAIRSFSINLENPEAMPAIGNAPAIFGLAAISFVVYLWNIFDAYSRAVDFNKRVSRRR